MIDYRIAYVDEAEADIRRFQRYNYTMGPYFKEVIPVKPVADIHELVSSILSTHCDALVVDFRLSEEAPEIKYDGGDVVKAFLEERPGFPVFILTTYEDEAVEQGPDVNLVNEKNMISEGNEKLLKKIEMQIRKYKTEIDEKEKKLLSLLKTKSERPLSDTEEKDLIDLDTFIQKSLSGKSRISESSKISTNSDRLADLLKKADQILNKLESSK